MTKNQFRAHQAAVKLEELLTEVREKLREGKVNNLHKDFNKLTEAHGTLNRALTEVIDDGDQS